MEKESHYRTWEELQMLKVQVAKLPQRLSGSRICDDGDGPSEGSDCMFDGKGQCMGTPMNKDSVEVKDDIARGTEGSEDPVADVRCILNDKARRTSQGQQRKAEVPGEGVAKPVHADQQIEIYSTDRGQSVQYLVHRTTTPIRWASARGRRVSNIIMRMKRQPRTRKASALRVSPHRNPLQGRKRTRARQNKLVTVRGENIGKDSDKAAGGQSEQPTDHYT